MTTLRFYGIDFSGDANKWTAGCRTSNVWVAEAQRKDGNIPRLVGLDRVQELPGPESPFNRLAALLAKGDYAVTAIDAPFSIPAAHIPVGGRAKLLRDIASLPTAGRPFAKGEQLIAEAEKVRAKDCKKPFRRTESEWISNKVNVRSTLWNTPRGGAPFTTACLTLIERSGRPCWPWSQDPDGLLAEAFPAGQLQHWGLPYKKYGTNKLDDRAKRKEILAHVVRWVECKPQFQMKMLNYADALDAFLCLFAAIAVADNSAPCGDNFEDEGWIAVDTKCKK